VSEKQWRKKGGKWQKTGKTKKRERDVMRAGRGYQYHYLGSLVSPIICMYIYSTVYNAIGANADKAKQPAVRFYSFFTSQSQLPPGTLAVLAALCKPPPPAANPINVFDTQLRKETRGRNTPKTENLNNKGNSTFFAKTYRKERIKLINIIFDVQPKLQV